MNFKIAGGLTMIISLSACGTWPNKGDGPSVKTIQPTVPQISLIESASGASVPVLDQEPLVLTKAALALPPVTDPVTGKSGVPIVWNLPANSAWEFEPENGVFFETPPDVPADIVKRYALDRFIAFDSPVNEIFGCRLLKPNQYRCLTTTGSTSHKKLKYSVHLRQSAKPDVKLVLDPNLWR